MLTEEELKKIELWRTITPSKQQCFTLRSYRDKLDPTSIKPKKKRDCFCSKASRVAYHKEFYLFYNNYNAPATTETEENAPTP